MSDGFTAQEAAQGAWRGFIDELAPLRPDLFRYCCGLTGNVWDGEDLAQDTLTRVFGALGKLNAPIASPRAYLIRSATNLWVDRLRRASLERGHAEALTAEPAPPQADASQVVDVRGAANSLFLHLAPRERAAVLLADVLEFSHEEAASMLQTTPGAIKQAVFRGRAKLKAAAAALPAAKDIVASAAPRAVVDRFVAALSAKDFDAIRKLCLADMRVEMVGGASFESYEDGKAVIEYAHMVMPGSGENPTFRVAEYEGEPMALGFRTLAGVEGLNEVWRFETQDGAIARLRLYCFTPDVLVAVAAALGAPALDKPYRSWPYGEFGPPMRPRPRRTRAARPSAAPRSGRASAASGSARCSRR